MKRVIGVPPEAGSKLFGIAIEFWLDEQVKASNNWFAALPDGDALTWIFRACRRLPTGWTSSTDGWCVARRGDDCCGFADRDARDVQRVVVFALQMPRFGCGSSRNLGTRWSVRFVIAALRGFGAGSPRGAPTFAVHYRADEARTPAATVGGELQPRMLAIASPM